MHDMWYHLHFTNEETEAQAMTCQVHIREQPGKGLNLGLLAPDSARPLLHMLSYLSEGHFRDTCVCSFATKLS